jgi:hypothetical protein
MSQAVKHWIVTKKSGSVPGDMKCFVMDERGLEQDFSITVLRTLINTHPSLPHGPEAAHSYYLSINLWLHLLPGALPVAG